MSGLIEGPRIRCAQDPSRSFDTVFVIEERRDGKRYVGTVVFSEVPPGTVVPQGAILPLSEAACQRLADDLWNAGFRPRGAAGSAGQLDAVQAHLKDVQEIARGFLSGKTRLMGEP